jgi:hypothetical protein
VETALMAEIKIIRRDNFELVYPFLKGVDPKANIPKEAWCRLLCPNWVINEDYCGYALIENGIVVGFLGYIFCSRKIHDRVEKFCNLTTWYVKEEYRAQSMMLLYPFLELEGYTLTNFTASSRVVKILKSLGFRTLDNRTVFLKPNLLSPFKLKRKISLIFDGPQFESFLSDNEKRIYQDHKPYGCFHVVIRSESGNCYLVMSRLRSGRIPFLTVRYLGNEQVFGLYGECVLLELLFRLKALYIRIDERLLRGVQLDSGIVRQSEVEKLYKSDTLAPGDVDYLYSELILLGIL